MALLFIPIPSCFRKRQWWPRHWKVERGETTVEGSKEKCQRFKLGEKNQHHSTSKLTLSPSIMCWSHWTKGVRLFSNFLPLEADRRSWLCPPVYFIPSFYFKWLLWNLLSVMKFVQNSNSISVWFRLCKSTYKFQPFF